ncbi:SDR family oxidoreductase [Prevotella sp. E15-22]|uniref:SDR family NAD(P)-dependent oxidoreductase n=1 Tax=Prevotella sp. E15-22 TaxID=2937774 RepID=UPI002048BAD0|nr:SDR family oxidoreductase [Prevotella sp. E15-22]UPS45269.1 SDR family oxidoreductase [Prevotella sp. E15-22]
MDSPFVIEGKSIFVTGAASGIGRATALLCAKMGAMVTITDLNEEQLKATFESLEGDGHQMVIANLTNNDDLQRLIDTLPKLEGVVCNAGIIKTILAQFADKSDIERILNINTIAPIYLTKLLLENKKIKKEASIVYTSSMGGVYNGAIGNGLYGASKAALVGFVKSLALELAPRGIRVNTVHPGITETNIYNNTSITPEQLEQEKAHYPLKRFGKPEEIANAIVFLLSDASKWMTGSQLLIDGGCSLV